MHAVESVVIEWSHQVQAVLEKSSAQLLLQGENPLPLVEINYWVARCADLESVMDQLCVEKVRKMALLLERTLSSYYPAFKAMREAIIESLEEARDIR